MHTEAKQVETEEKLNNEDMLRIENDPNNYQNHDSAEIEWGGNSSKNISSVRPYNDEENKSEGYNLNSNNKEESKNSENIHEM